MAGRQELKGMDLRIHQALFGYRGGHKRLAGSLELPSPDERDLLLLTDLAAPGDRAFSSYLTGFPLRETAIYALCRTWPAPEMPRPGSVWTHVLLVPFPLLGQLTNIESVLGLFHKPGSDDLTAWDFERPLEPRHTLEALDPTNPSTLATVIDALYSHPDQSVVIAVETFGLEQLAIAIWRQQWPKLRRGFRFCTWTTTARRQGGKPFDLLIAPRRATRTVERELQSEARVVLLGSAPAQPTAWLHQAASDATEMYPTDLRQFLWTYGSDVHHPRAAFRHLSELKVDLQRWRHHPELVPEIVQRLCTAFPTADDAAKLKTDLLGFPSSLIHDTKSDVSVLQALATVPSESVDVRELGLKQRAGRMWSENPKDAIYLMRLLVDQSGRLRKELAAGLASRAGSSELSLLDGEVDLVAVMTEERPQLLRHEESWPADGPEQTRLLKRTISTRRKTKSLLGWVVEGSWNVAQYELVGALEQEWGTENVLTTSLDVAGRLGFPASTEVWNEVATKNTTDTCHWIAEQKVLDPPIAYWMAGLLDPLDPAVSALPCDVWNKLPERPPSSVDARLDGTRIAFFALAVGLRCPGEQSERLISWSFPVVYGAAARGGVAYKMWSWLSSYLPTPRPWQSWDRCKQLRKAITLWIAEGRWSPESTAHALEDPVVLVDVLDRLGRLPGGSKIAKTLVSEIAARRVGSKEQAVALDRKTS